MTERLVYVQVVAHVADDLLNESFEKEVTKCLDPGEVVTSYSVTPVGISQHNLSIYLITAQAVKG
jgi:hypothetical protein